MIQVFGNFISITFEVLDFVKQSITPALVPIQTPPSTKILSFYFSFFPAFLKMFFGTILVLY